MHAHIHPQGPSSLVVGGVFLKECFMLNEDITYTEKHQTDLSLK